MNQRGIEGAERKIGRVGKTLCSLCLCGFTTVVSCRAAENWPLRYNEGVTAYRSNDFTSAATAFEEATASPDRTLQQRSFYNLGNARYRMGEADPMHAMPQWERALKGYESALALDPKDADASFNRDLVKKRIEELKKQQQQQQQNQQNQQRDKQQQQQESKQDRQPSSQDQQQQDQPQPEQQPQQKDQQQQTQQQPKPDQSRQEPQQPEPQQAQPQQGSPENLEKQQAAVLLDNLREEERNWNFFPEVQMKDLKDAGEPAKDW